MIVPLEQYITSSVTIGPIVDSSDGHTPVVTSIAASELTISKNNGTFSTRVNTDDSIHIGEGFHRVNLDSLDVDTLGSLIVQYYNAGGTPVPLHSWVRCQVYPKNVYSSLYTGTEYLQTDIATIEKETPSGGNVILDLAQLSSPEITTLTNNQGTIISDLGANSAQNAQLLSEHITLLSDHVNLDTGHSDILAAIAAIAAGDLNDNVNNKQIIAKALKDQDVSGIVDVAGSIYKALKDPLDVIVGKLPSGTISDLTLNSLVDGNTLDTIFQLVMAMVNGRMLKDFPNTGDITFYKRDNATVLTTVSVSETERVRS